MYKLKPPQIVIFGFLVTIIIGGLLLSLPQSSGNGVSIGLLDAFFTSTSALFLYNRFGNIYSSIFHSVSAFGTVGLSTGITPILSSFGKVLIMKEQKIFYKYPEEKIMVG